MFADKTQGSIQCGLTNDGRVLIQIIDGMGETTIATIPPQDWIRLRDSVDNLIKERAAT